MMSLNTRKKMLAVCIGLSFCKSHYSDAATEFNTDVLDIDEHSRIDLSHFSRDDYILPGDYLLDVKVNNGNLGQRSISVFTDAHNKDESRLCFPADLVGKLALKPAALNNVRYWHNEQCADLSGIEGARISNRIGQGELNVTVPQAWMKYSSPNWVPPEQWEHGIPGLLLDYNLSGQIGKRYGSGQVHSSYNSFSSYGTAGANAGAWRLRADYQANSSRNRLRNHSEFSWNRFYGFRPLPDIGARLAVGELYLESDVFNNFRFTGANLRDDERMLPPELRGYAQEIRGIANSNATVRVLQDGRILYETTVPAGPFTIQDLGAGIRGKLQVRVEEDNGHVSTFEVNSTSLPYLTRPGRLRYNLSAGVPSTLRHRMDGPGMAAGDFSWGLNNTWSLYGGSLLSANYQALNLGSGVNLNALGAMSMDITHSRAQQLAGGTDAGLSVQLQYAKRFDDYDSQITFAGYRFSQRKYIDFPQYLSTKQGEKSQDYARREKQSYVVTANKTFWADDSAKRLTTYLSYSQQHYWNSSQRKRLDLTLSKTFDVGRIKNVAVSLTAYKAKEYRGNEYGGAINLSVPIGSGRRAGYDAQVSRQNITQRATLSDYSDPDNSWNMSTGVNQQGKGIVSGYYTHNSPYGSMNLNSSWQQDSYAALSGTVRGGVTATAYGAAAHRDAGSNSRIMVNTGDVGDVPIDGGRVRTNRFGIAVVPGVNSYYDTTTRIDVNNLPYDVEAVRAVVQGTLTEGAIGYRNFEVVRGEKMFASLRTVDGTAPPFGAVVVNKSGREISVVNDDGTVYLSGVKQQEKLDVAWEGKKQCRITIPANYQNLSQLLLPCE